MKLNITLSLFLLLQNTYTIEKPYTPPFSIRHPHATALLVSAGGYTLAKTTDFKYSFLVGGAAFLGAELFNKKRKISILDLLLSNPQRFLREKEIHTAQNEKFIKENNLKENIEKETTTVAAQQVKTFHEQAEKRFPLINTGECVQEDWFNCLLSRTYQPQFRTEFEKQVVTAMNKISSDKPLQYVSFGSGGCLQDLIILTKFLAHQPQSQIVAHFIDLKFSLVAAVEDVLKNNREIDHTQFFQESLQPEHVKILIEKAKTDWGASKESDEIIEHHIRLQSQTEGLLPKEIVKYITTTFTHANFKLMCHPSTNSYLEYLKKNNLPFADIITAADIQDEMSLLKNSLWFHKNLCKETLQNNPQSLNFLLGKHNKKPNIAIIQQYSLSADGECESQIQEFPFSKLKALESKFSF